jgi:hypothetical protein
MSNKLNSFMDNIWDGFYTGQVRMSRFPAIVVAEPGAVYDLTFTGTPAKHMRFRLTGGTGLTVRIAYPSAESRSIWKNGVEVEYTKWSEEAQGYGPITQSFCGENRYIGVVNILEFYITDDCDLEIKPRDAV